MSEQRSVSVVIPCFNGERYLQEAIDSALSQSVRPLEVIVVDDGSTDASVDIATGYGAPVSLARQPNAGAAAARNAGAALARGVFIAFLDADDLWTPASLRLRLAALEQNPEAHAAFGGVEQFVCDRAPERVKQTTKCPEGIMPARSAGSMIIRRSTFEVINGFDETVPVGEMFDFVQRLEEHAAPHVMIPELVMRRRIHGGNMMLQRNADYFALLRSRLASRRSADNPSLSGT